MGNSVSPSTEKMTRGQMGKFYDLLVAKLEKSSLPLHPTQEVIEEEGALIAEECVSNLQKWVEARLNTIIRVVRLNRTRTPQEAIHATGKVPYLNDEVVATMPRGDGEEVEVVFFKIGKSISCADLEKEYELRGLKPDPYAQAAVNEADQAFADEHPNGSQWKDAEGNYCCAIFYRWHDRRYVRVNRRGDVWFDDWWFSGVRK